MEFEKIFWKVWNSKKFFAWNFEKNFSKRDKWKKFLGVKSAKNFSEKNFLKTVNFLGSAKFKNVLRKCELRKIFWKQWNSLIFEKFFLKFEITLVKKFFSVKFEKNCLKMKKFFEYFKFEKHFWKAWNLVCCGKNVKIVKNCKKSVNNHKNC